MGWLDKIQSVMFRPRATLTEERMSKAVKAAYYSAASDSATMDFSFASDIGVNRALLSDLNKLRNRCRYELRQNGVLKGLPKVYANSVVGTGPRLKIVSPDAAFNRQVEKSFASWAKSADAMTGGSLGMQIHLGVRQLFPCGEYFLVPRSLGKEGVRLRYLAIRPDRVQTPHFSATNVVIDNGVELNADGIPVAYHITKQDSDISPDYAQLTFDRVPAEQVIHVFGMDDPVQHRGEPWFAAMLPNFHKLRRYDEATIAAAIVAAKFAAVLVNTNPAVVEDAGKILPTDVWEIADGQMMVPPPGYEPKQIEPKHPSTNASDFRRDQIGTASAAAGMPVNIATQDSSRSNFASARFDGVTLAQEGEVTRQVVEDRHLRRVFQAWLREAQALGLVPEARVEFDAIWLWPEEQRHSDPLKQANADRVRVETGQATVSQVNMEQGYDGESAFEALVSEVEKWRAADLKHPLDAKTAPAAPAAPAEEAQPEDDEEEEDGQKSE